MDFDRLFEFLRECSNFWMVVRFFLSHCECGCPIWNRTWVVVFEIMGGCSNFCAPSSACSNFWGLGFEQCWLSGVSWFACLFEHPFAGACFAAGAPFTASVNSHARSTPFAGWRACHYALVRPLSDIGIQVEQVLAQNVDDLPIPAANLQLGADQMMAMRMRGSELRRADASGV